MNIAVLASTRGTDLQAIMDEIAKGTLPVNLKVVISDRKDCLALKRAKNNGYPTVFIDPKNKTREEYDRELLQTLQSYEIDLVVLVGYMRMIGEKTVKCYRNRMINVHPALIPAFCGKDYYDKNVHAALIKRGVKVSGITIHFVTEECDAGPIILQKTLEVSDTDTPETLKEKIQTLEKKWYPEVIRLIAAKKVKIKGNKVILL